MNWNDPSFEFLDRIPPFERRKKTRRLIRAVKTISYAILISILFFAAVVGWMIYELNGAYGGAMNGKAELETAIQYAQDKNFSQAVIFAQRANDNFEYAYSLTDKFSTNPILGNVDILAMTFDNLKRLFVTGEMLSRSAMIISRIGDNASAMMPQGKYTFEDLDKADKRKVLQSIYESTPELNGLKADLELASINMSAIDDYGLLFPVKAQLDDLKTKINQANAILNQISPLLEAIPKLAGYPSKSNFLLMLQNNNELRPTGGFLGTYGILQIDSGIISRLDTHDIYHMDMPVQDKFKVTPPEPLIKYLGVNNWYLRDANWSPDWREASKKITWFYQEENKRLPQPDSINGFDGVIAITPDFVSDLIRMTGPIQLEGETYTAENFSRLLEYRVEMGYEKLGVSSWHRKEVIGEILKILKARVMSLDASRAPDLLKLLSSNLSRKNILLSFSDENLQEMIARSDFAGTVKDAQSDYVMAVDANMAALKTDSVMNRTLEYDLRESGGNYTAQLKLNYEHQGVRSDWRTSRYQTYTRIYLPAGIQLKKVSGFVDGKYESYKEFNKTVIAGYFTVEPSQDKNIFLEYQLPASLADLISQNKSYNLFLQKQPGKVYSQINVSLDFQKPIHKASPGATFTNSSSGGNLEWEGEGRGDKEIGAVF